MNLRTVTFLTAGLLLANPTSLYAGIRGRHISPHETATSQAIQLVWSKIVSKCGTDYFAKGSPFTGVEGTLHQYHGVKFKVSPEPLDAADHLNGLGWHGTIVLESTAHRPYDPSTGWGNWIPVYGEIIIGLVEDNGRWQANNGWLSGFNKEISISDIPTVPPTCSELPPL